MWQIQIQLKLTFQINASTCMKDMNCMDSDVKWSSYIRFLKYIVDSFAVIKISASVLLQCIHGFILLVVRRKG